MKVFVQNQQGQPLMPTTPRKARLLLKEGKARIVGREPFTIRLLYGSSGYKQDIVLGIDAGYETIGYAATTDLAELMGGEVNLLKGQRERLQERAMHRRNRRHRNRYRKARFDNRAKAKGWLAPSIQHKLNSHLQLITRIRSILPIRKVVIEVANFDIQAIKNPDISGAGYQQGEQVGFWNLREYILHRDGHKCQNPDCKTKPEKQVLQVHHLGYWQKDRSDRPGNLITLCTCCHTPKNHQPNGFLYGWRPKLKSFRPETFMSTVRWRLVNESGAEHCYGYMTKSARISLGLEKSHPNDAFVIAGGATQERAVSSTFEQVRHHRRSRTKFYDARYIDMRTGKTASGKELFSGRTKRNKSLSGENLRQYRGQKVRKGRVSIRRNDYQYQPGDMVCYQNTKHRVKGVQNKGAYIKLDGLSKPVRTDAIAPFRWRRGTCLVV